MIPARGSGSIEPFEGDPVSMSTMSARRAAILVVLMLTFLCSCEGWKMERAGRRKCEEGLALVQQCVAAPRGDLSPEERGQLLTRLSQAKTLITEGMASFTAANEKTGKNYDTASYREALIVARKMMMELRD